jgi:hypothetical protein
MLRRDYSDDPSLRYFKAKRVTIDARPALPTEIDGDELAQTPLEVEVIPGGVRVLVPESYDPTTPPDTVGQGRARRTEVEAVARELAAPLASKRTPSASSSARCSSPAPTL